MVSWYRSVSSARFCIAGKFPRPPPVPVRAGGFRPGTNRSCIRVMYSRHPAPHAPSRGLGVVLPERTTYTTKGHETDLMERSRSVSTSTAGQPDPLDFESVY